MKSYPGRSPKFMVGILNVLNPAFSEFLPLKLKISNRHNFFEKNGGTNSTHKTQPSNHPTTNSLVKRR